MIGQRTLNFVVPIAIYRILCVCVGVWRDRSPSADCKRNETKIIPRIISHFMIHTCIDVTFTFAIGTSVSHALPYNHLPMLCPEKKGKEREYNIFARTMHRHTHRIQSTINWIWNGMTTTMMEIRKEEKKKTLRKKEEEKRMCIESEFWFRTR